MGASPSCIKCQRNTWKVGFHGYALHVDCPILAQDSLAGEWRDFVVTNDVKLLNVPVYLRLGGLSTDTLGPPNAQTIHPDQHTIALETIIGTTEEQADIAAEAPDCEVAIFLAEAQKSFYRASLIARSSIDQARGDAALAPYRECSSIHL